MNQAAALRADDVLALARSRTTPDRERLLLTIVDVCEQGGDCSAPSTQALLAEIFLDLISVAEHDIRLRLSEKLAGAAWPPRELVTLLARDDIDIARPIIARSPVLQDHDLIRLLVEATVEHQIEVARRPALSEEVVKAVIDQGDPDVLAALAGNATAQLSQMGMARLVAFSERMAALRAPLTRHPLLTSDLAGLLYGWVGESLRAALSTRFEASAELDTAIREAVDQAHGSEGAMAGASPGAAGLSGDRSPAARAIMEARMVQKLQAAGQLRPGLLIRALHEGRLSLFVTALGVIGGFAPEAVRAAVDGERPQALADACASIGIDRSAFPTVLSLVRRLNGGRPGAESEAGGLDV